MHQLRHHGADDQEQMHVKLHSKLVAVVKVVKVDKVDDEVDVEADGKNESSQNSIKRSSVFAE
jgi:hypothetical protein